MNEPGFKIDPTGFAGKRVLVTGSTIGAGDVAGNSVESSPGTTQRPSAAMTSLLWASDDRMTCGLKKPAVLGGRSRETE